MRLFVIVMSATLHQFDTSVAYAVYYPVLGINTSAPIAGHISFEWFGHTYSVKWVSVYVFEYRVYPIEGLLVLPLPVQVVVPRFLSECQIPHPEPLPPVPPLSL